MEKIYKKTKIVLYLSIALLVEVIVLGILVVGA